jgi:hypothetical protein
LSENLEDVKKKLYAAFDKAIARADNYDYFSSSSEGAQKLQASAQCLHAAAQTAQAIATVENQIAVLDVLRELREKGADVELDIEKGLVRSITPMSKIKLKGP